MSLADEWTNRAIKKQEFRIGLSKLRPVLVWVYLVIITGWVLLLPDGFNCQMDILKNRNENEGKKENTFFITAFIHYFGNSLILHNFLLSSGNKVEENFKSSL